MLVRRALTVGGFLVASVAACSSDEAASSDPGTKPPTAPIGGPQVLPGVDLRGECRPTVRAPESGICPGTCGNGRVEDCSTASCGDEACAPVEEECDDSLAAPVDCTKHGFVGGTASCHSCLVVDDGCQACVAGAATSCVVVSGTDHGAFQPNLAAIPDSDDVLVTWTVSYGLNATTSGIHVARVRRDGTMALSHELDGTCAGYQPAVAPTSTGALVAYKDAQGVKVVALDASLVPRGEPRLVDEHGWAPQLAAGARGGAALAWFSGVTASNGELFVSLVADDATEAVAKKSFDSTSTDHIVVVSDSARYYLGFIPLSDGHAEIHVIESDGTTRQLFKHDDNGGRILIAARGDQVRAFVADAATGKGGQVVVLDGAKIGTQVPLSPGFDVQAIVLRQNGAVVPIGGPDSGLGVDVVNEVIVERTTIAQQARVEGLVAATTRSDGAIAWWGGMSFAGILGGDPRPSPIRVARMTP